MIVSNIIVAFPKIEDARNIKMVLQKNGLSVSATCSSGSHAINVADTLDGGIVICGHKLTDMMYTELKECLPSQFKVLLVASEGKWNERECQDVVFVPMPLKTHMLIDTVNMMLATQSGRRKKTNVSKGRSEQDNLLLASAKRLLMEKNDMTEDEAHRYIQKCSMDSGNSLIETAGKVLSVYG